jgi:LysR family cys regulon transcriptional activator
MKLQQLKYLLAIVDNGLNITAAADRLYTSQPGVSKQIKLLEEELGLQLFSRKGKSLERITAAGQRVVERARLIMHEAENIRNLASDYYQEEEGSLSIGATHTQMRYVLPEVVTAFRQFYPRVSLNLCQGTSEQIADMAAAGEIDLAIATGPNRLFSELLLVPGYCWDRAILVPNDHKLAGLERKLTLQDLAEFPLVTYVFSFDRGSSIRKAFAKKNLKPAVVFTARDTEVIKTYVRMGLGVGIIASMAHECQNNDDLTAIEAAGLFPRSTTWIGFRKTTPLQHYTRDFIRLFAPHIDAQKVDAAAIAQKQEDIDALFKDIELPIRTSSPDKLCVAA